MAGAAEGWPEPRAGRAGRVVRDSGRQSRWHGAWHHRLHDRWLARRPPRIALALALAALLAHVALFGVGAPWGRLPLLGAALAALGAAWVLWAGLLFRAAGTTNAPTGTPVRFVDHGPYAFGRHPMYLGITVQMLGLALALGSPVLAGAAALFVAIVGHVHVPHEEAQLRRAFGGWYSDYAAEVRRWV
jgi:protein-S-isoprenylcysteine O-methyltransferase Ste14